MRWCDHDVGAAVGSLTLESSHQENDDEADEEQDHEPGQETDSEAEPSHFGFSLRLPHFGLLTSPHLVLHPPLSTSR